MNAYPIDKLERQLQDLLEGAFTRLFRRAFNARDIGLLLLRAMEDQASHANANETIPIAPDRYTIYLHPDDATRLIAQFPELPARLARLIADLCRESGYLLLAAPEVSLRADHQLGTHQARVTAAHSPESRVRTDRMSPVSAAQETGAPAQLAQLQIVGAGIEQLTDSLINIGRDNDNDVVIDDAYVSRRHIQLRRRSGAYTLFDVNSSGGTRVNSSIVSEHRLQHGDVIRIGQTDIIYMEDSLNDGPDGTTQVMPPG